MLEPASSNAVQVPPRAARTAAPGESAPSGDGPAAPTSDAALQGPRPEIWFRRKIHFASAIAELWGFRELVFTLAERDLRVRYKQATLGLAWSLITPVLMMLAFTVLFTRVTHVNTHAPGVPYALFAYAGLLPWTFFAGTVTGGGTSLVTNVTLLNKLYCPREVFPVAAMIDAAVDAVIGTVVLILLFAILGFAPKIEVLYLPLLLIPLIAFTLGVTLTAAALVVFMRDLQLILPLVLQVGLFVSPVVYSPQTLFHSRPLLVGYSFVNPLVPVLDGIRRTALLGQAPDWLPLAAGTVSSVLVLAGGYLFFKHMETGIADVA